VGAAGGGCKRRRDNSGRDSLHNRSRRRHGNGLDTWSVIAGAPDDSDLLRINVCELCDLALEERLNHVEQLRYRFLLHFACLCCYFDDLFVFESEFLHCSSEILCRIRYKIDEPRVEIDQSELAR